MLLRVIDFETSGLKPPEAAICQIGYTDVVVTAGGPLALDTCQWFVDPGHPIPPEASGVHHIVDRDVVGAQSPADGLKILADGKFDAFVAHHAEYDRQFFSGGDVPWICTRKAAMRIWPDAPNHKNQTLRYWLGIDSSPFFSQKSATPPHRAGADTHVTAHILIAALDKATVAQMIEWTSQPSLLPGSIHFGKHKGTPWPKVDPSYLDWIVKQVDMDEDVRFTARYWLTRRTSDDR